MSALPSKKIIIIGAGTLGSIFSLIFLKKHKFKEVVLIDPDKVTSHNIKNQIYSFHDVKKYKVEALASVLRYHYPCLKVKYYSLPFQETSIKTKNYVVVDAADNLNVIKYFISNQKEVKEYIFAKIRESDAMLLITKELDSLGEQLIKKEEHSTYRNIRTSWENSILFSAWITKHYFQIDREVLYSLRINETLTIDKFLLK